MKKNMYVIFSIICACVITLVVFTNYSHNFEYIVKNKPCVVGTIESVSKSSVLIDVAQNNEYYRSSDKIDISTLVEYPDESYLSLKVGDYIAVYFDGTILETYPAQITHTYGIIYLGD